MTLTLEQSRQQWRERREARRAKQREQNVLRAARMHEARLRLFPPPGTSGEVRSKDSAPPAGTYIGCSGWYYWHWKSCFYPEGLPSNQWFAHYTSRFRTVELNAPFYSWPMLQTVSTWKRQCGARKFIYTIKVNELITHTKRFARTKELVQDFYLIADLLGPRMGCFLVQLPPSFRHSSDRLKRIVAQLDPAHRNVVEFHHKSWWRDNVYEAFRGKGIIFCSTSGPRLPDELIKTADDIYVRFHGTRQWYRHDYTKAELEVWAERIRASGAKRVWAYFNNDREGYAIKNARELMRQLRRFPKK